MASAPITACLCVLLVVTTLAWAAEPLQDADKILSDELASPAQPQNWRGMETQSQTDDEWIPADSPQQMALMTSDEPAPKRRRPVRKRKRRPVYETEDDAYPDRLPVRSRNRRPQRLDHRREQWFDEMMAEEPYRPVRNYNRRRLYPKYDDDSSRDTEESPERIRDPYTALEEEQSSRTRPHPKRKYQHRTFEENLPESTARVDTEPSNPIDLKTLLKQSGNISLSELLQQRNLSLSDLLKGEIHAISALTEQPETEEPAKQNKRPSKQNIPSTTSEPLETSTTERRIFVPSHPKYYTSVDYKPLMNFSPETTERTSQSTSIVSSTVTFSTSEQPVPVKVKLAKNRTRNALPTTLAKLKTLLAKTTVKANAHVPTLPPKAIQININEIFGVANLLNATSSTEIPMEVPARFDEIIGKQEKQDDTSKEIYFKQQQSGDFNKDSIENTTPLGTDTGEIKARDELIEILSDSASRANLTRLLKVRNMTLEELIEQRERGSSQKHLADIFHNQTKEPEASEETIVQEVIKASGPLYQQSLLGGSYFPENTKQRESRNDQLTDLDSYKVIANSVYQTTPPPKEVINKFLPLWRQAYNTLNQNEQKLLSGRLPDDELIISDEAQRIEDIENRLADAVNGALNVDVLEHKSYNAAGPTDDEDSDFFRLPQGVRSAIIASAVIGGLSLFVFLTIFIIFKWTQRHRKHLSYTSSFSGSRIKTPILQAPYQKRIFNSLMNNTLGRKKKICTIYNDPQSLQEYLWETDRKPFQ